MILRDVRVTVLVENESARPDLRGEHGFSVWIDTGESKVLFDTGASGLVCKNAEKLGIDLSGADAIVLSHGHYDHTGGLAGVAEKACKSVIHAHPAAGVDVSGRPILTSRRPELVAPGIRTTGEVERVTDFEPADPRAFRDDQGLFFEVDDGLVVVVGCAHAGVVNTLRQAARLTDSKGIHAVFGGMHLLQASDERLRKTVQAFRELGLRRIGPCHCTGENAITLFEREFQEELFRCQTGTVMTFGGRDG